jgi:FkbM family methyltransferase
MTWYNALKRRLVPYGTTVRVLRGPMFGTPYVMAPGIGFSYMLGVGADPMLFLREHVAKGMKVYDVGANCGQMALFFMKAVGLSGRVVCIEPAAANVRYLRASTGLQRSSQVRVIEAAAGRSIGKAAFLFDEVMPTTGGLQGVRAHGNANGDLVEVDCITLDGLIDAGEAPPDLIKIDVEGGGLEVLSGAELLLRKSRPMLFFEIHAANVEAPEYQALQMLRDRFGYELRRLSGQDLGDDLPQWGESIFCVHSGKATA